VCGGQKGKTTESRRKKTPLRGGVGALFVGQKEAGGDLERYVNDFSKRE